MALASNADSAVATDTLYHSPDNNDCSRYKILATKILATKLTFYQKKVLTKLNVSSIMITVMREETSSIRSL